MKTLKTSFFSRAKISGMTTNGKLDMYFVPN